MVNIKKITINNNLNEEKKDIKISEKIKYISKTNNKKSVKKLKSPIFYISKFHKRKCSHSNSKTKKNFIKKLVFQDYLKVKPYLNKNSFKANDEKNLNSLFNIDSFDSSNITNEKNNFSYIIKIKEKNLIFKYCNNAKILSQGPL